jgi:hypothetical protein
MSIEVQIPAELVLERAHADTRFNKLQVIKEPVLSRRLYYTVNETTSVNYFYLMFCIRCHHTVGHNPQLNIE